MSKTYSAGIVTAYGAAKRAGYQGTYEDFCRQQAGYAESAAAVETAKNTAVSAANTATTKAGEATTAATAAQTAKTQTEAAADVALTDIGIARSSAISEVRSKGQIQTENARAQALAAATSATTASTKASEASASATSAGQSATNAAASATSAAQSATAAQDVLDSIPADYSEMSVDVDKLKADLADVTNHAVKSAEQLISDKRTVDKVPYKYRASASGKSDRAYDMIVGGTVCFNQLVKDGNFSNGNEWKWHAATATYSNNIATIVTADNVDINSGGSLHQRITTLPNHKYIVSATIKGDGEHRTALRADDGFVFNAITDSSNADFKTFAGVATGASGASSGRVVVTAYGQSMTMYVKNVILFDLTAMFGTTIADHIYTLEQATAGAGAALFRAMFPNEYYPYNTGELISVEGLSAHVMRDADNNIIGSYPLDSTLALRGVPVLNDGKVEFDGDMYSSDGTVTRRYGIVDLGTLDWGLNHNTTFGDYFYAQATSLHIRRIGSFVTTAYPAICSKYVVAPRYLTLFIDKTFCFDGTSTDITQIQIKDSSYADTASFQSAMSGVYLVYELATPTTETATPYTSPQVVSPYGTEEYISESVCPVGHITEYPDNLRAKIDGLPWDLSMIAPVETAYKATRNYTTGQLLIVDNVLYKVTANIANGGTIAVGTNVVATTLSEVIASLS